ncbi:acetyl-CoA synthetase-like protein [Marasmius fiardii PR-910]|nr:acetyl-CoA synthetase-like protein [Marasmius fiardii PR-910]
MLKTPLHILREVSINNPTALAFKIPLVDPETDEIKDWHEISFIDFASDVDRLATYWAGVLERATVSPGSVVSLWSVCGFEYLDTIHLYCIRRAGYVPHVFSRLPGIEIVKDLLREADSRAVILGAQFREPLKDIQGIPIYNTVTAREFEAITSETVSSLPPLQMPLDPLGTSIITHTSGSTSGRPKLVRGTHRWVDAMIQKSQSPMPPRSLMSPSVGNWIGNICHMAQLLLTIIQITHSTCIVQPRTFGDLDEIIHQIRTASVTRLYLFSPLIVRLLHVARSNPDILELLRGLECIIASGAVFPASEHAYAVENDINVAGVFASTEVGVMLMSDGIRTDPTGVFQPINVPGVSYDFYPVEGVSHTDNAQERQSQPKLLELVVKSDSIDCPPSEFCQADDGHFHTGDLWEFVQGGYVYRGRDDDWIKTESALRCDTKAIEDTVRRTCGDYINDCVVVGYGRLSPVLFVETSFQFEEEGAEEDELKRLILKRIEKFNSQQMAHERIQSTRMIVVVPTKTLPRTAKGNVPRKVVEDMFKDKLDLLF